MVGKGRRHCLLSAAVRFGPEIETSDSGKEAADREVSHDYSVSSSGGRSITGSSS
jgi:hypothetical protein